MNWSPDELDRLERAITDRVRISLSRRGTEYVVIPRRILTEHPVETLVATHPTTGEDLEFSLDEVEDFSVLR